MTRQNPTVLARVGTLGESAICQTTLGELHFGAIRSGRLRQESRKVRDAIKDFVLYDVDRFTARRYAGLKSKLAAAGTPIPENDLWIAAAAAQHGFTHDAHLARVPGLSVQVWPK